MRIFLVALGAIALAALFGLPVLELGFPMVVLAAIVGGLAIMFVGLKKMSRYFWYLLGLLVALVLLPPVARTVLAGAQKSLASVSPQVSPAGTGASLPIPGIPWLGIAAGIVVAVLAVLGLLLAGKLMIMAINRRLEARWRKAHVPARPVGRERAVPAESAATDEFPTPAKSTEITLGGER